MPATETPTKTREYWSDWVPRQAAVLSIDEVLQRVQERGADCDVRTLRSWQTQGVLPYPVRQRKGTGVYAAYPPAAVDMIVLLREMQSHGLKLDEIGPRLRVQAKGWSDRDLRREFSDAINTLANIEERITGALVRQTEITFTDDVGRKSTYTAGKFVRWKVDTISDPSE